jgi:hypothetical protein
MSLANVTGRPWLDARLVAIPLDNIDGDRDLVCELAHSLGMLAPRVRQSEFARYRYLVDIDGNTNSWGFLAKLLMGSCILKVESPFRQWYYDRLRPWEHYIPIRGDLSDLEERVQWCREHDEEARQIGATGKRFADGLVLGTEMAHAATVLLDAAYRMGRYFQTAPGLQIESDEDGVLVREENGGKIHRLNPSAALLLELCNGQNRESDLANLVQVAFGLPEPPAAEVRACLEVMKSEKLIG